MTKAKYHIFMGDVVASSTRNPTDLLGQFKGLIGEANKRYRPEILSPYTITLGDEFQGIAKSLKSIIETIFFLEEEIIRKQYTFKLHYVAHWGEVATRINRNIAYEMMGPGLATARTTLATKKRKRPRFVFLYGEPDSMILNDLFLVVEDIVDRWKTRDFDLITDLVKSDSDAEVALQRKRDRTLVWRRRESLRVAEYKALKRAAANVCSVLEHSRAKRTTRNVTLTTS